MDSIIMTDLAADKIKALIEQEDEDLNLRVYVQGGGCSGFQYGFKFEKTTEADDIVVEHHGVKLLIDPFSFQYLVGITIDYRETLTSSEFVIKNLAATSTCGCGSSFSV